MNIQIKHSFKNNNLNLDLNLSCKKNLNSKFIKILGGALDKMKYYAVDRIEGDYAILENTYTHKTCEVKTSKLPPFLDDGDVLKKSGLTYEFDFHKTNELKKEVKEVKEYINSYFILNN